MTTIVCAIIALLALAFSAAALARRFFAATHQPPRIHYCKTSDGWQLALNHYPAATRTQAVPVLLIPGLSANRYTFDLREEFSLARFLNTRGFDVVVMELRDHGNSQEATWRGNGRGGWNFSTYLHKDFPACLDATLALSGSSQVHLVGHSMGGIIATAALTTPLASKICSVTSIAASLHYGPGNSQWKHLLPLKRYLDFIPLMPLRILSQATSWLAGTPICPVQLANAAPGTADHRLYRSLSACAFGNEPLGVLLELSGLFELEGLRDEKGEPFLAKLPTSTVPFLALSGDRDIQCPEAAVKATVDAISVEKQWLRLGLSHGSKVSYGHFDFFLSPYAQEEVFAPIASWIEGPEVSSGPAT